MARGRIISKSLGSSRKFAALAQDANGLGEFAQVLYPLLVVNADDFGRQSGDAFTVKHAVFPTSRRSEAEFDVALLAMQRVGLVDRYDACGMQVLQIEFFDEHQTGLSKRSRSKFPGKSGNFPEIPLEQNRTELKGTEEKGTEPKGALRARFERWWAGYPKKVGKDAAEREWNKIAPGDDLANVMEEAVIAQRASEQWRKDGGQFIPHPRTWLHQGRWKDSVDSRASAQREYWADECKRLHGGTCTKRWDHEMRIRAEAS